MVTATVSVLLPLSVHRFEQKADAKSSGTSAPNRMMKGSLTRKRCPTDHSHDTISASSGLTPVAFDPRVPFPIEPFTRMRSSSILSASASDSAYSSLKRQP